MEQQLYNIEVSITGRPPFFHNGFMRRFSFLNDPTVFGMMMAISSILILILLITQKLSFPRQLLLLMMLFFIVAGMGFSGTRTAYVMIPVGLVMYGLMTLNRKATLLIGVVGSFTFALLLFGPFYGNATLNRVRSAFLGKDESLEVRDVNRAFIQSYIYKHPLGGGVGSTGVEGLKYNPGHYLAGFPPDSYYLRSALETGWVGLILLMTFWITPILIGIRNYYHIKDQNLRGYTLGLTSILFSMLIAGYAQASITGFPLGPFMYVFCAIIICMPHIEARQEIA
jgi:O-antigen ligase